MGFLALPTAWGTWGHNGLLLGLSPLIQKVGMNGTLSPQDCGMGERDTTHRALNTCQPRRKRSINGGCCCCCCCTAHGSFIPKPMLALEAGEAQGVQHGLAGSPGQARRSWF